MPLNRKELTAPCAEHPEDWDLDAGTPARWRRASQICHDACPVRESCAAQARSLIQRNTPPVAMIWAGIAYNRQRKAIADLDHYHATRLEAVQAIQRADADLIAEGCTTAAIANRLSVSKRAVDKHVSKILAKPELRSRIQIAGVLASPQATARMSEQTDTLAI
ncbi:LuxR C-terminal-related transcriptional regulator [Nocardia sp. CA-129566]|uniref:LuxR C-terminal-related transcriptional regulator n=1 Tax=Nocardia sp. CA-129566 TaxID=3239976 RepID=UPI003D976A36